MSNKASKEELNELHALVAKALKDNLDDPKVLSQAIAFLKNNSITVEELPEATSIDLFTRVEALKTKPNEAGSAVEELLKLHA